MVTKKLSAIDAFQDNMADAHHLVRVAKALSNSRSNRMRRELRQKVGEALKVPAKNWDQLDCLQSEHVFVTFLPGSKVSRKDFDDHRPFLRQAIVAAAAAAETFIYDRAMERVGPLIGSDTPPARLLQIPTDLTSVLKIRGYEKAGWAIRVLILEPYIREQASTAPSKVGEMLSLLGVPRGLAKIDVKRRVEKGDTEAFLKRFTERRNKIAHQGDRSGRSRAPLNVEEVESDLALVESVVAAIAAITEPVRRPCRTTKTPGIKNPTKNAAPAIDASITSLQAATGDEVTSTPPELSAPEVATSSLE